MKNYEDKEVQRELAYLMANLGHVKIAVNKTTQLPVPCRVFHCNDCAIDNQNEECNFPLWLNKERKSDEMLFAESLNEGDIAEFSDDGKHWHLRYFKEICSLDGTYTAYNDSCTGTCDWKYIRKPQLVKENEDE